IEPAPAVGGGEPRALAAGQREWLGGVLRAPGEEERILAHTVQRSAATLWMKPCWIHSSPVSRVIAIAPHVAAPCGDSGVAVLVWMWRAPPPWGAGRSHARAGSAIGARGRARSSHFMRS